MFIKIMLDKTPHKNKPTPKEASAIQRRLRPVEISFEDFCVKVGEEGHTFRPGIAIDGAGSKNVVEQQVFCLDFDGKMKISEEEVRERSKALGIPVVLMYNTFSSTTDNPRFRAVFAAEFPITDMDVAKRIRNYLLEIFPEADQSCRDAGRLYYGGKGILYASGEDNFFDPVSVLQELDTLRDANDAFLDIGCKRDPKMEALLGNFDLLKYLKESNPEAEHQKFGNCIGINPCPICGHLDDFRLYTGRIPTWFCFGAEGRIGGDAITLIMETEHLDFAASVLRIQNLVARQNLCIEELERTDYESGLVFEIISKMDEGHERAGLILKLKRRSKELGISARDFDRTLAAFSRKCPIGEESEYVFRDNQLLLFTPERTRRIANFNPLPKELITMDDGQNIQSELVIDIVLKESTIPIAVSVENLANHTALAAKLPLLARINPAQGSGPYVLDCIRSRCSDVSERKVFTHTGFRIVDQKLVYLHGGDGGAIGGENIDVKLPESLRGYRFDYNPSINEKEAVEAVLRLFSAASPNISYPLLATTYLAPVNYFLGERGIAPTYVLFLRGPTGSFKTAISLLYLSHFRKYAGPSAVPPENFNSTSNAIEKKAYSLKDSLLLVDDFHPSSPKEKVAMTSLFQRLARGAGDGASRGRLKANLDEATTYIARGLIMVTGEDSPVGIEESGIARLLTVDFAQGGVEIEKLTRSQDESELLNAAMSGFIRYLIKKNEKGEFSNLRERFQDLRKCALKESHHRRQASNVAWALIGLEEFAGYAKRVGVMESSDVEGFIEEGFVVLAKMSADQTKESAEEKPAVRFLTALDDLLVSKEKLLVDLEGKGAEWYWGPNTIGFEDKDFRYVLPGPALTAVVEYLRRRGDIFPVGKNRLFKDLAVAGYIECEGGRSTIMKRFGSCTPRRYLVIKKSAMEEVVNG